MFLFFVQATNAGWKDDLRKASEGIVGKKITNVDELVAVLENYEGGVMIEGVYEDYPGGYYYAFGM